MNACIAYPTRTSRCEWTCTALHSLPGSDRPLRVDVIYSGAERTDSARFAAVLVIATRQFLQGDSD